METKELEEIKKEIDIKLAVEIAKSVVHEMGKMENAKSNKKLFAIISYIMCITCIICIVFTALVGFKVIEFVDSVVIEEQAEDIVFDTDTGNNSSGDAVNIYNSGNNSNVSNNGNISNNTTGGGTNGKGKDDD